MSRKSFEIPKFDLSKLELPSGELPEAYREWAKGGVAQLKDGYEKIKSAQSNAAELVASSYKVGAAGALSYGAKVMDNARANSDAAINLFGNLACATSFAEAFELSTAYLRKQYEAAAEQGRQLTDLARAVATETVQPIQDGLAGVFPKAG
jgi:phasin